MAGAEPRPSSIKSRLSRVGPRFVPAGGGRYSDRFSPVRRTGACSQGKCLNVNSVYLPMRCCAPRGVWAIVLALFPIWLSGCGLSDLRSRDRMQNGYVIVLPGIEGRSTLNWSVAKGLADGGVPAAIEVYDWTLGGSVFTAVASLRAEGHNRSEAKKIARQIIAYQDSHPGKPTHIVGHSGGGGGWRYLPWRRCPRGDK